ncbi:MAG: hypothetical protein JNM17_33975 [Archangium sp.]|nr:hypothetical protein [Archangium sp.]
MSRQQTREALLGPTLEFAATSVPFYRRTLGRKRALTSLPFLHKEIAIRHQRELLSSRATEPFTGIISSGTHHGSGALLQIPPRSIEEIEALREFFAANAGPRASKPVRVLEVRAAHHGNREAIEGRLLVSWTYSAQSLRLVEQMLSKRAAEVMVINSGALMPLTSWFLSRGVDAKRFGIREIGTTSFRLSPFWRALVEATWGARLRDNFSLSELPAPALECLKCGFHHWEPPPLYAEVIDPDSKKPLTRRGETGVLVVTTLAPFVTRMPLIRYWTGDLVTIGPRCDVVGETGFRPRGRLSQSVWKKGLRVASLDVSDFLEGRPEVARHPHAMETLGLIPPGECGAVKYELTARSLKVELRFDPLIFRDEAQALGRAIAKHLRLKAVELVRPGTITSKWAKF